MLARLRGPLAALWLCLALGLPALVDAARPLLDQHQWDHAFALFAQESYLPWRPTTIRLTTYSSAPVDFSAYAVQPTDVLILDRPQGRAISTEHRRAVVRWRFTPPAGYRAEGNQVVVPLGDREGFFIIEARRGNASEQVWINRTRIGLLSKTTPDGFLLYGTDLGTGQPLAGMRLAFLVGSRLLSGVTGPHGTLLWRTTPRPRLVLAAWGHSRAALTFLPQAPPPPTIVALRLDRNVVHTGSSLAVAGFVRQRSGDRYRPASGTVRLSLLVDGQRRLVGSAPLDPAGAFSTHLFIPSMPSTQALLLAESAGGGSGATLRIERASALSLTASVACESHCRPDQPIAVTLSAMHPGLPTALPAPGVDLALRVVRSPHLSPPGGGETHWEATTLLDTTLMTDSSGHATFIIPAAHDELPSTFSIEAHPPGDETRLTMRFAASSAPVGVAILPEQTRVDVGEPIGLLIRGFRPDDGHPISGPVVVRLRHGTAQRQVRVMLDMQGRGRTIIADPPLGDNLVTARFSTPQGSALDATSVSVAPEALRIPTTTEQHIVVTADRPRYAANATITLRAKHDAAHGTALLTLDALRPGRFALAPVRGGKIEARLPLRTPESAVAGGIAFVDRNGVIMTGSVPLAIDAPGQRRLVTLHSGAPHPGSGSSLPVEIEDGTRDGVATTVIDLRTAGVESLSPFDGVADLLATEETTTQTSASSDPLWHPWVTPAGSRARDLFADLGHHLSAVAPPNLSDGVTRSLFWHVVRSGTSLHIPLPIRPGAYLLSVMRIYDDGGVGDASLVVNVS